MSDIPLDEATHFDCITSHPTTGAATDADSTPTFAVYEEVTDTDIGIGGNLTKRTSLTGNYRGTFTLSAANGFEVGKWYSVIASATVNAIAGKAVVKNFRVKAAEATAGYSPPAPVDRYYSRSGTLVSVASQVLTLTVGAVTNTYYIGGVIEIYSGTGSPRVLIITDGSTDAGDTVTVLGSTSGLNSSSLWRMISPVGYAIMRDATTATQAATVSAAGKVAATIAAGDIASGAIDATAIATDAITAAKIAAGAIGVSEAPNLDAAISTRLAPTTSSRTLDVSATGGAGIDWSNVEAPTTTVGLTNTTVGIVTVVGSVTGGVGGNVSGSVGSVAGAVGSVIGSVGSVGSISADGITSASFAAGTTIPRVTLVDTATELTEVITGGLDAAGVRAAIGLVAANLDTQLAAIDDFLDTEIAAIKLKTDLITIDAFTAGTRFLTMVEQDGGVYRYTTNAVEQVVASGGGGDAQEATSNKILQSVRAQRR